MKRKVMFFSLAIVLLLAAALAGCSSSKKAADAGKSTTGATGSKTPPKIHILSSHMQNPYTMQMKPDDPYVKELSRLSGYDLKFEFLGHAEDYKQQLSLRFASGDLPDLVRTDSIESTIHPGAVDQGAFLALDDLIDKYGPNLKKKIPEKLWKIGAVSKNGKIYGIPAISPTPNTVVTVIRQDWLDKLGMKAPVTTDDYLKFFEGVKNTDLNGNGKHDEYGISAFDNLPWSLFFMQSFDAHPNVWQIRDGKMIPNIVAPQMKEAIAFYRNLVEKGYINPDFLTQKEPDNIADINNGKAGSWTGAMNKFSAQYSENAEKTRYIGQPDAKITLLTPPKGPKGFGGMSPEGGDFRYVYVIPAKTKNPEEIIKFLDWCWSAPEADDFFSFGIKDVNYKVENGKYIFDVFSPANVTNGITHPGFWQENINPKGVWTTTERIVATMPQADKMAIGFKAANDGMFKHADLYMPQLKSIGVKPELQPGFGRGTLFLDMFAKVVMGKEPLEPAFDNFVAEWYKRGGDKIVQEANDWYNSTQKK